MRLWCWVFLLAVSLPSHAEWSKLTQNDRASIYLDDGTIDKDPSSRAKVWLLFDLFQPDRLYAKTYRSAKEFVEFDCGQGRYQIEKFILYPAPMGQGGSIDISSGKGLWTTLEPTDARAVAFHQICSGKPVRPND